MEFIECPNCGYPIHLDSFDGECPGCGEYLELEDAA